MKRPPLIGRTLCPEKCLFFTLACITVIFRYTISPAKGDEVLADIFFIYTKAIHEEARSVSRYPYRNRLLQE